MLSRRRFNSILTIAAMLAVLGGCHRKPAGPTTRAVTLNVFAAASLTESFREIGKDFESQHPGVKVSLNFAGSQQLREQLENGATADVFASANTKEMDAAKADALVLADSIQVFARNRLVVIYPRSNPGHLEALRDIGKPGVRLVLADPAVPVGKYTIQMLDKMIANAAFGADFKSHVLANVVSREDNVKSVVMKVQLGEADAGVAYQTDMTPQAARFIATFDVSDVFNPIADYPVAMADKSTQPALAREFIAYVIGGHGQKVLGSHGFTPP